MPTYVRPFPAGTIMSQAFGSWPNNGVNPRGGHTGNDYAVATGTPVRAAADGVIEHAGPIIGQYYENPWWLTEMGGNTVVLNCGNDDYSFVYAHLHVWFVKVGDYVKQGQIIADSGNTGTATTGPHCHVETLPPNWNWQNGTFGRVNPESVFDGYWEDKEEEVTQEQIDEIVQRINVFSQSVINQRSAEIIAEVRAHTSFNADRMLEALKAVPTIPDTLIYTLKAELSAAAEQTVEQIEESLSELKITLEVRDQDG